MSAIAYFITPHGFGHATRACAVMAALQRRWPQRRCEIFTQTPRWIFEESLDGDFGYHPLLTDIGLAQQDALRVDLPATLERLAQLLPYPSKLIDDLSRQVTALNCQMVFCDIAPLGVTVARAAGLPAVVVENFTWDWIYREYLDEAPALQPFIDYLAEQFTAADVHIQTEPVCTPNQVDWPAHLVTAPVARRPRTDRAAVRRALGIPESAPMVLVTMGGMNWNHRRLDYLAHHAANHFVFTGSEAEGTLPANVHLLDQRSGFYHPDLVAASDAVIGKIGYSTLAEVYQAGIPYGYVARTRFRESQVLVDYVAGQMSGLPIAADALVDGNWVALLPELLSRPRYTRSPVNGADQIAEFVSKLTAWSPAP